MTIDEKEKEKIDSDKTKCLKKNIILKIIIKNIRLSKKKRIYPFINFLKINKINNIQ